MESTPRYGKALQSHLSSSLKQRRSGYEPSDTETEWQESPWREPDQKNENLDQYQGLNVLQGLARNKSPLSHSRRTTVKLQDEATSQQRATMASLGQRRRNKSPYAPRRDDVKPDSDSHRNVSPFSRSEQRRHISPYKTKKEEHWSDDEEIVSSNRKYRLASNDTSKVSERSNYSRRAASAPKARLKEFESFKPEDDKEQKRADRNLSPLPRIPVRKEREGSYKHNPSGGEINEMLANAKISNAPPGFAPNFQSTDSIAPGDIFFSRDYAAFPMKNSIFSKNGSPESKFTQKPKSFTDRDSDPHQRTKGNYHFNQHTRLSSATNLSTETTTNTSSAISRQTSNLSDYSGRTNGSTIKFVANRQKNQSERWFSCIKKGTCRTSKRSPQKERAVYETTVIEKAFVVESLRQFWADKYQPGSLSGFTCHKQEALLLKQLVSSDIFPHILLKGPPGSGKKALIMALLSEIFGPAAWNISHKLQHFHVQERRGMEVAVPVSSSTHHVELNLSESDAIYALMSIVKQISADHAAIPEISTTNSKPDYKVIVLYDVDKATDKLQRLIKWIMDGYSDACKLILHCVGDASILEPIKSLCKIVKIEPPVTHEIMEVLIQIARKEDFELPMSFAAKVANKSKQNMRRAIMALEACKAHNYPFIEDQPIPLGWEEALVELASEILADPSHQKLYFIRGKFQKLLQDFVHPKLILLKLVEQFLKRVEAGSKRELYYWHAYYEKRLPTGTSALLKLEEFTAKIMSIYRRSHNQRQVS